MSESEHEEKMQEESEKLIHDFANLVNNFSFGPKYLLEAFTREHRTLQQNMFRTILQLIFFMASDQYLTDGRNQGSKRMAEKFIAGYAEIIKKQEAEHLKRAGYSPEQVEEKAEEYRLAVIAAPGKYIGLSHI